MNHKTQKNQFRNFIKENWFLFLAIVYIISPFDLIPDILAPILGPFVLVDDLGILLIELYRRFRKKKKSPINRLEKKLLEDEIEEGEIIH